MNSLAELFARIEQVTDSGCWLAPHGSDGYWRIQWHGRILLAHRVVYELISGPIPEGLTLDHTCHNLDLSCAGGAACIHRSCINPSHHEPVSRGGNVLRGKGFSAVNKQKAQCPKGHPYSDDNTATYRGSRFCLSCRQIHNTKVNAERHRRSKGSHATTPA